LVELAIADLETNGLRSSAYFLEVQGTDPAADLLAQLPKFRAPVRVASEARKRFRSARIREYIVVDPSTGKRGASVWARINERISHFELDASFGWDQATLAKHLFRVRLTWNGERWEVAEVLFEMRA
jgi:hypothetical protein